MRSVKVSGYFFHFKVGINGETLLSKIVSRVSRLPFSYIPVRVCADDERVRPGACRGRVRRAVHDPPLALVEDEVVAEALASLRAGVHRPAAPVRDLTPDPSVPGEMKERDFERPAGTE